MPSEASNRKTEINPHLEAILPEEVADFLYGRIQEQPQLPDNSNFIGLTKGYSALVSVAYDAKVIEHYGEFARPNFQHLERSVC